MTARTEAHAGRDLRADAVLVGVTLVWGTSFVVVKNAFERSPPLQFLFWRFGIAALLVGVLVLLLRARPSRGLVRDGVIAGMLLAGGMSLQVLGVPSTTASKAAFLTGLSVVLTPFAGYLRTRRLPSFENTLGVFFAGAGFFLLTFPTGGSAFDRGDLFVGACGVVFAFYIVELAERSPGHDALAMTGVQLACVCVCAGALSLLFRLSAFGAVPEAAREARPVVWHGTFLWSVLYLATVGTIGTFFGQTWAQKRMSATHAAILFALEPVFAAVFAAWLLRERLGARGILGGSLVLVGIVVSEMRFRRS